MLRPAPPFHARRRGGWLAPIALLGIVLFARGASASNAVTLETGGGQSKPTPTIAASWFEYQKLSGRWEPGETSYFSASLRLTRDFDAAPTPGTQLATGADWVLVGTVDAGLDLTKHWTMDLGVNGSPSSTRDIASPLQYPLGKTGTGDAYALMTSTTSSLGATGELTFDTFDADGPERPVDASFDASVAYERYATSQRMASLDAGGAPVTASDYVQANGCSTSADPICAVVTHASQAASQSLDQLRVGATATATFATYTDLALDAAYFAYPGMDPTQAGFFSYTPAGAGGQTATYGSGLPLIPPRWTLRPEVGHKWHALSVRAYYQFTDYATPDSVGHTVGGKVQLYAGKWRVYATGSYRADVSSDPTANTWSAGLGATWTF